MRKFFASFSVLVLAIAAAIVPASSSNADQVTFDLSGFNMSDTLLSFPNPIGAGPGTITGIDYNFSFTTANGSWLRELQVELTAPGATQNNVVNSGGQQVAWVFVTPANSGTVIWGTPHPEGNVGGVTFTPTINLNGASGSGTLNASETGNASLNGYSWGAAGNFQLRFADTFNDGPSQGTFGAGSFVTVNFTAIPEPTSLTFLSIAGLVGCLRRRR